MPSMNRIELLGHLGQNPNFKITTTGKQVATFTLATNDTWTDAETQERHQHTEWHDVEVWGAQAKAVGDFLLKGRLVFVEGHVRTERWEDKETKQPRSRKKVVANRVMFLDSKPVEEDIAF